MAKYSKKCGPNATDEYDDYSQYGKSRSHRIYGEGAITNCYAQHSSNYNDSFDIQDGITELCDECFNFYSIDSVSLPSTLEIIGDRCFPKTKIISLQLPAGLKSIGHNNFPSTLSSLEIPAQIKDFPIDNILYSHRLTSITVNKENKVYKAKDGILYNYDMTEMLFCPNAKEGKVIIPNTVTRIGDYCFAYCKKLDMIIIPPSVVEIGDYAFQQVSIKKLNIINSVKSIGAYCFKNACITEKFKFTSQISLLPKGAFEAFESISPLKYISQLVVIGEETFRSCIESALPSTISLYLAKEINSCAFKYTKGDKTIELFSSLDKLGDNVFDGTSDKLVLRYFSYSPIRIGEDAFGKIGNNATLVVPKGTKIIYENASPWMSFPHIEEWDADIDRNEEGEFTPISDEVCYKRLLSIADSKNKADRFYLKEIISELAQSYLYIDSDEEYDEALAIINYNRNYTPVIVPELERDLCKEWPNKYKLKLLNNIITESNASQLLFEGQSNMQLLPHADGVKFPLPELVEIPQLQEETRCSSISAYFNNEILRQLQNLLISARQSVKIAVSWFTNFSLFKQIGQMAENGINVQLIINNDLINNGGYCLNFNELIDKGVMISLVEFPHLLHHKFVIIDDYLLVTGSYNWTRFSEKNYENIVVICDESVIKQFCNEFDELLNKAEYKCVDKMPDSVKERPEYDRSAFKQYITEELNAQSRETSDERDKITALKKAVDLNPEYLDKINSGVQKKYNEAFKALEDSHHIQEIVIETAIQVQKPKTDVTPLNPAGGNIPVKTPTVKETIVRKPAQDRESIIEGLKASSLIMVLDISGSMKDTYSKGHVYKITKKAISASLALTKEQEIGVWTFGDNAVFIGNYGVDKIDQIVKITCKNQGTYLQRFVEKANDSIKDGALCIIFTDDDSNSISAAIEGMKRREQVFWQIIAYERDVKSIMAAIKNIKNTSVVTLSDYQNRTDEEISNLLLKDYIKWKCLE